MHKDHGSQDQNHGAGREGPQARRSEETRTRSGVSVLVVVALTHGGR